MMSIVALPLALHWDATHPASTDAAAIEREIAARNRDGGEPELTSHKRISVIKL